MIKKLYLTNFKGISDTVEIEFKPITLLFGPNSAGKSTIIQALHYLKEIFERKNFDPINTQTGGKAIDLGGFKALVNNQDYLNKSIRIRVDLDSDEGDVEITEGGVVWDPLFNEEYSEEQFRRYDNIIGDIVTNAEVFSLEVKVEWHPKLNRAELTEFKVFLDEDQFLVIDESRSTESFIYFKLASINFSHQILKKVLTKEEIESFKNIIETIDGKIDVEVNNLFYAIPDWSKDFVFPDEFTSRFRQEGEIGIDALRFLRIIKSVVNNVGRLLTEALDGVRYIGPLREVPQRGFVPHPQAEEDRWANGIAAWDALFNQWVSHKLVNEWLDKLKTGYGVTYREYFLNQNNFKTEELTKFLKNEFNDLMEYAEEQKNRSVNSNKEFELFYYKKMLELQAGISSNKIEKISQVLNGIIEELKDQLTITQDNQMHSWANIIDEINAVGEDIEDDFNKSLVEGINNKSETIKKLCLIEKEKQILLEPYDIGIGISQVLPVVVAALMADKNLLSIEQPELHTHPAMQVELADLFIAEINKRNLFCLLETHSEHLMLRFLKRLRETSTNINSTYHLTSDQIAVYYIEQFETNIYISSLGIDERGRFKNKWPRGFFEERHGELF